jgi:hypothetical protein
MTQEEEIASAASSRLFGHPWVEAYDQKGCSFTSTAGATFSAGRRFSTLDSVESIKNHTGSFLRQLNTWLRAT